MNITSNGTTIYAKEFNGRMFYRAGISRKKEDGSYERAFIDVKLPKGNSVADKTKINIINGFLSFYKNKEGKDIFYIVVQDFVSGTEKKQENIGNSITVEELDENLPLPF